MKGLVKGNPTTYVWTFPSDPLVPFGSSYSEIEHIYFGIKRNPANDADDAYFGEEFTKSQALDEANHRFILKLRPQDTSDMFPLKYTVVLAIKVTGNTIRIELELADNQLEILADGSRA